MNTKIPKIKSIPHMINSRLDILGEKKKKKKMKTLQQKLSNMKKWERARLNK